MRLGRSRLSAHWRAHLTSFLNLLFFGLALLGLDRLLAAYQPGDVIRSLAAVPITTIVLAAAICAIGYLALVGYDYVAFRVVGPDLSLLEMLVPSFVSFAVSNNAPASVVTAGGVRYLGCGALNPTALRETLSRRAVEADAKAAEPPGGRRGVGTQDHPPAWSPRRPRGGSAARRLPERLGVWI